MVRLIIIRGNDPRLASIGYKPLVTALPYKDERKTVHFEKDKEFNEDDEYAEQNEEEETDYEGLRVGTRAHVSYDLVGYNRNAMLIFNATGYSSVSSIINRNMLANMADITNTFAKLRFEIVQHVHLANDEIADKCQESAASHLQAVCKQVACKWDWANVDFSNYGCVAVVAITLDGVGFNDSAIIRHWKIDGNPTLRSKPKIYINEGQLHARFRNENFHSRGSFYSAPITEDYPDVLCLHLTSWPGDLKNRPMRTFCRKLDELADYDDMVTIIKESVRETRPMYRTMIYVASTLERRLFLNRTEYEVTRL